MNTNTDPHSNETYLAVLGGSKPGNARVAELMLAVPTIVRPDVFRDANRQHLALGGRWSDAVRSAIDAYVDGRLRFECEVEGDACPGPADGCALFPGYSGRGRRSVRARLPR